MSKEYAYKLFEYISSYNEHTGSIETKPPIKESLCITDFVDPTSTSFHTSTSDGRVCLSTDDKFLGLIIDESGSMTWNDNNNDRVEFYKDLLQTLHTAYPGQITVDLIGFGGVPVKSDVYVSSSDDLGDIDSTSINTIKTGLLSNSVYDLAGIRVVRKTTGFPIHSMDGVIVSDGIFESVKDENLEQNTDYYYKIFTYNKYGHFSSGVPIQFTTHPKPTPRGADSFVAVPRILPGAERDNFTKLILNCTEKSGSVLYDSSGDGNHCSLSSLIDTYGFWSGEPLTIDGEKYKYYEGCRFSGNGYVSTLAASEDFVLSTSNDITINLWVYRYTSIGEQTLISVEEGAIPQYAVFINAAGQVHVMGFMFPNLLSTQIIPEKEWTMVSIVFSKDGANLHTEIYINGLFDAEATTAYPVAIATAMVYIGGSTLSADFVGGISSVSIHNKYRNYSYISALYAQESKIFYADATLNEKEPPDNTQREVLLQWKIADDFDYSGGIVKIVRKYNSVPSNSGDGTTIYTGTATAGDFYYLDSSDLINGSNFYYKIFTINSIGNECTRIEARIAPVYIPISTNIPPTPPIQKYNLIATPGNGKVKLSWSNNFGTVVLSSDSRIKGARLYYSNSDYPVINIDNSAANPWSIDAGPASDSLLLTDTTGSSLIHRTVDSLPLSNGSVYFYTLISYDEKGNISDTSHAKAIPSEDLDDIIFPSDDVTDVWAELINREGISIHWKNPTSYLKNISLWFDQSAIFYTNVTDLYGGGIKDLSDFNVNVEQTISRITSVDNAPDKEYQLNMGYESDGIIKGILSNLPDRDLLTSTNSYTFNITPYFVIQKPNNPNQYIFKYVLPEIQIIYKNPIAISMSNLLFKRVPAVGAGLGSSVAPLTNEGRPCQERFCSDQQENSDGFENGGYITSSEPYICRIFVYYREASVPDGTPVQVTLYQSGTSIAAEHTSLDEPVYYTQSGLFEDVDIQGRPTGRSITKSFVDVKIHSPTLPEYVDLYAIFTYDGISKDSRHSILWASTLKFDLQTSFPRPDGIEKAEQLCHIYFVDPDDPSNSNKYEPVSDGTLVKWELVKGDYYKERPFYSLDSSSQRSAGVYSKTKNGIARNIWFGPVSNIESHIVEFKCAEDFGTCCVGEEYQVVAQVILDGETIKASKWVGYECEAEKIAQTYSKILIDGEENQRGDRPHFFAYADGEEMIHLQIASDPSSSDLSYAECFRKCMNSISSPIIPLPCNQIVNLYTGGLDQDLIKQKRYSEAGMEVIWNATFDTDPYTGEEVLLPGYSILTPTSSTISQTEHVAHIPVKPVVTDLYLRWNKFIGNNNPSKCKEGTNLSVESMTRELEDGVGPCEDQPLCHELDECPDKIWKWDNVQPITCNSLMVVNNKVVNLTGGGEYVQGTPPLLVGFVEPLEVTFVDIRINGINGQKVPDIVVDGKTRHTFVVKVTFSGKPVPNGTPVYLKVEEVITSEQQAAIVLSSNIVYTYQTNDPLFDPSQVKDKESLIYFEIDPLPDSTFSATIYASCEYDKRGDAKRNVFDKIKIENTSDGTGTGGSAGSTDEQLSNKTKIYSNEVLVYDTTTDSYTEYNALLESRAGHFSAIIEDEGTSAPVDTSDGIAGFLYLASGFNGNTLSSTTEIYDLGGTSSVYSSNITTPRAFGQTAVVNNKMYCIGGIEHDPVLKTFKVSQRVECFDPISKSWQSYSFMPDDYGVAFGCSFVYGSSIYIMCGCTSVVNDCEPQNLNDKILRYDVPSDEWTIIDVADANLYGRISPMSFIYNDNIYVFGGSILKDTGYLHAEMQSYIDFRISEYKASLFASSYYSSVDSLDLSLVLDEEKQRIIDEEMSISPYTYVDVGFIYNIANGTIIELDEQWTVHPSLRDKGEAVFVPTLLSAFFIGGSDNSSTTLNTNESVDISTGTIIQKTPLSRGRSLFRANLSNSSIYITGGLTSGHSEKWLSVECRILPGFVEAQGKQTCNLIIVLRNDSGEILDRDIPVLVRGYLKIPGVTDRVAAASTESALARIFYQSENNKAKLEQYLSNIVNPNNDEFQFNSSKKVNEDVSLFPVLLTKSEFIVHGIATTALLPRSEDPFSNLQEMAKKLTDSRQDIRDSIKADASGTATEDQLNALESILSAVGEEIITIESFKSRDLYEIEVQVTILDEEYFGQTVCRSDLNSIQNISNSIQKRIQQIEEAEQEAKTSANIGGSYSLTSNQTTDSLYIQRDSARSGQSASSKCLFGVGANAKHQSLCPVVKYFNNVDWVPQIKEYIVNNSGTPLEAIEELDKIGDSIPFGSSQVYTSMFKMSQLMTDENLKDVSKNIYINSDNSENLSAYTLDQAISEVNSIDGEKNVPVIYTIFSTSYPISISSRLSQSQTGDVERIAIETGGHSTVLSSSSDLPEVLNFVVSVSGGIGYGIYRKTINLGSICTVTKISCEFDLYINTDASLKYRHSTDGRTWSLWSDSIEPNSFVDISSLQTQYIEIEAILQSGFIEDINDPYITPTGIPCLTKICIEYSMTREDFLLINYETADSSVQQLLATTTGDTPSGAEIKFGVATSDSNNWEEYHSTDRPAAADSKKTLILDRDEATMSENSVVSLDSLKTKDGLIFSSSYGPWSETAAVKVYDKDSDGNDVELSSTAYKSHPRQGQIITNTKYPISKILHMSITTEAKVKVALQLLNSNHAESIKLEGTGYIYSTNLLRPASLSQTPPMATKVKISPPSPNPASTISVTYDYVDLNRDEESGTLIRWFKSGTPLLEINDKLTWSSSDLLLSNKLKIDDLITVAITPGDGRFFGTPQYSPAVKIVSAPPVAVSAKLIPTRNGVLNSRVDTSSVITADYSFETEEGAFTIEEGTIIDWYVNSVLYKEVLFSTGDDEYIKKSLFPFEQPVTKDSTGKTLTSVNDVIVYEIGNQIYAEILPKTKNVAGDKIRTNAVTIQNSIPIAQDVRLLPLNPTANTMLEAQFLIQDPDFILSSQVNSTEVKWYKSSDGITFTEMVDQRNSLYIQPSLFKAGDRLYYKVTPYDNFEFGQIVGSPTVLILPA